MGEAASNSPSTALYPSHQADDGSLKTIKILNTQVSELAAQKGQLLSKARHSLCTLTLVQSLNFIHVCS